MRKFITVAFTTLLAVLILHSSSYAQDVRWYYECGCPPPPAATQPSGNYPHCNPDCVECLKNGGAYTVLGCIPQGVEGVVNFILRFTIGIGGGVAFLFMVGGAFKVMTSGGDPGRLSSGKSMISGGVLGILVIVFATVILRLIGYDILRIPGFKP